MCRASRWASSSLASAQFHTCLSRTSPRRWPTSSCRFTSPPPSTSHDPTHSKYVHLPSHFHSRSHCQSLRSHFHSHRSHLHTLTSLSFMWVRGESGGWVCRNCLHICKLAHSRPAFDLFCASTTLGWCDLIILYALLHVFAFHLYLFHFPSSI